MKLIVRDEGDLLRLGQLARVERDALQRDRFRAVLLALQGQSAPQIAQALGRSRRGVQDWVYAYRDGGIDALWVGKSTGRPSKLPREMEQAFKRRLAAGPGDADGGVCVLRGEDARRILEREFGVAYSLQGVYDLLERLNLSCLVPRPRHRKNDPQVMQQWVEQAPLLSER